jgi:hypothetical protein
MTESRPPKEQIRQQLHRILASPDFDASPRSRGFLEFLVTLGWLGRAGLELDVPSPS